MLKRFICLIAAMALIVVSLAACGGSGSNVSTSSDTATTDTKTDASADTKTNDATDTSADAKDDASATDGNASGNTGDVMDTYTPYPETVTIHTVKRSSSAPNLLDGDTVDDNPMTRYIKDKVNVEFVTDWEVEGSEFANKLALNLAAGTLPDMFTLGAGDYLLYRQLVENDMLADLMPGYERTANQYLKDCFSSYDGKNMEPFMEDGKLYALAGGRYGYEHNQLWMRKDWLEELKLEIPKTQADLENVLQAFIDAKGPEAALLLNSKDVSGVYSMYSASPLFAAYGAYPRAWITDKNGDVIWGSTAPEVKEGLAVLADWYKRGLIDKQFATRTGPGATDALFTGGQSGAAFAPWWYVYTIGDFPKNVPEGDVVVVNAPLDANGKYNIMWPGPAGEYIMVNKKFANPEAIYKVIACEFDMWRQFDSAAGDLIKPTRDNNVSWTYLFPTSGFNLEPSYCIAQMGKLAKAYVETGSDNGVDPMNPMNIDMAKRAEQYSKDRVATGMNWIDYYGRYVASNMMDVPEVSITYPAFDFVTESMADFKPNLDTLEQTTFLQIVTGEKPIDAFDQFVKDWYAQGGQQMTDEVRSMVAQ